MPPLQALLAAHGFWIMMVAPLVVGALWYTSPARLRWMGLALTTASALAMAGVVIWVLTTWLPDTPPPFRRLVFLRILFVIGTAVEYPLVEVTVAGIVMWLVGSRRVARLSMVPSSYATDLFSDQDMPGSPDGVG